MDNWYGVSTSATTYIYCPDTYATDTSNLRWVDSGNLIRYDTPISLRTRRVVQFHGNPMLKFAKGCAA